MRSLLSNKDKGGKTSAPVRIGLLLLAVVAGSAGWMAFNSNTSQTQIDGVPIEGTTGGSTDPNVQPTATYSTKEKLKTDIVGGTSYYAKKGQAVSTTAITNVNLGESYVYWVSNATTYVKPKEFVAGLGANPVLNDQAWANATATLALYDNNGRAVVTSGAINVSLAANAVSNIELSYQGTSKKSAMPFGGLMAVEFNNSITSVSCSGANIAPADGQFHLTYVASSTQNKYALYNVLPSMDDGVDVSLREVNCQFNNGASPSVGSSFVFTLYGANYYVTNDGNLALDTEQFANQLTTRTVINAPTVTGYWKA